jgi:uncharacterized protein (DUF2336 family)
MIIEAFLHWTQSATASQRAKAAGSLARAYADGGMCLDERRAAETALIYLLDDPSPKVRLAMSTALAQSTDAPRLVIHALSRDQIEVAGHVVALSPLLSDGDLVDLLAEGHADIQRVIAMRQGVSRGLAAAIAEIGSAAAICDLLDNADAQIAQFSLRRIAERHGESADVRSRLIDRQGLPLDLRHQMVLSVGEALAASPLVRMAIGEARVARVTRDACVHSVLVLAEQAEEKDLPALVEHLRLSGRLTPALLVHLLCHGAIELFTAALVRLTDQPVGRVQGILRDGRPQALAALFAGSGLAPSIRPVFVSAVLFWREVIARGKPGTRSVAEQLVRAHGRDAEHDSAVAELLMLVERLNLAQQRRAARSNALGMAARAA